MCENICHIVNAFAIPGVHGQMSASEAGPKFGQPGGDTLSDFVTLVCQEAHNAQQVSAVLMSLFESYQAESLACQP